MRVAIIVGHNEQKQGKCSPYLPCEFEYNKEVSERLCQLNNECKMFIHSTVSSYRMSQIKTAKRTKGFDVAIELHYNSFHKGSANGTECFYYLNSVEGRRVAKVFQQEIIDEYGTTNRGVKPLSLSSQNGYGFVVSQYPPSVLVEPFFGSNKGDSELFADVERYAKTLNNAIKCL